MKTFYHRIIEPVASREGQEVVKEKVEGREELLEKEAGMAVVEWVEALVEAERARVRLALEAMAVAGSETEAGAAAAVVVLEVQAGSPVEGVEMAEVARVEEATEAAVTEAETEGVTAEEATEGAMEAEMAVTETRVETGVEWEMVEEVDQDWEVVEKGEAPMAEVVSEADSEEAGTGEEEVVPGLVGREVATGEATGEVETEAEDSDLAC